VKSKSLALVARGIGVGDISSQHLLPIGAQCQCLLLHLERFVELADHDHLFPQCNYHPIKQ
jgi:hypothetical protein